MKPIVLLSDARITEFPVRECGEPLVDLRDIEPIRLDTRLADDDGAYARVRATVADRLVAAQTQLPRGIRLLVIEGYRPAGLQERYFADSVDQLRAAHPGWTREQAHTEAARYISPPEIGPHVSGAAVDLTLCTASGVELPMGTEVNATPLSGDGACYTDSLEIPAEAVENRRILRVAMTAVGFVNYPTEWWHWSYGDRYWAFASEARHAHYGTL
ncbi:M15 family metallopeptidase [Nonomuraea typhae]|uniref:M15 family metallopeptidase n=1 Tax=Nonomuraea typhae TaxID=2603600 RepID=UPI0012F75147|nr:M15 family metallopeptidase [Nonomuraea typhae]